MTSVWPRVASVAAAACAGLPILVGFFVWHWFNIAPVWGVLIEASISFPIALFGISWAWSVSRQAGRFGGRWGGLAFGAVFVAGLVVEEAIGLARGRPPSPTTGAGVITEVLFAAIPVVLVGLAGWRIVGRPRAAAADAVAGLPLILHLGGTVMHLGGAGIALRLFAILVVTYLLAGVLLAALEPPDSSDRPQRSEGAAVLRACISLSCVLARTSRRSQRSSRARSIGFVR
jgi:hypothetical protein